MREGRSGVGLIRWGWHHHRALTATWALCVVLVGVGGLGRAISDNRSGWLNTLFLLGVVGAATCVVMLFRRHPD